MRESILLIVLTLSPLTSWAQIGAISNSTRALKKLDSVQKQDQCPYDKTIMPKGMEYVCNNMAKFSCEDKTITDGTGAVRSTAESDAITAKAQESQIKHYTKSFQDFFNLADPVLRDRLNKALGGDPASAVNRFARATVLSHIRTSAQSKIEYKIKENFDLDQLSQLLYDSKVRNLIETTYASSPDAEEQSKTSQKVNPVLEKVKKALDLKLDEWAKTFSISPMTLSTLRKKLSVPLSTTKCTPEFPTISYSKNAGKIIVCNDLVRKADSEYAIAFALTRELAKAIDPCSLAGEEGQALTPALNQHPFKEAISCLTVNKRNFETNGPACLANTTNFAFADWVAGEVLPQYIKNEHPKLSPLQKLLGYSNAMRASCAVDRELAERDIEMPTARTSNYRINQILMANPVIREDIGCGSNQQTPKHCPI